MFRVSLALVLFLVSPVSAGDIIHVPADSPTIQIAILKAMPFDTIIVAPGTYSEAISYMGKVIVIQSENPNDPQTVADTIIDAGGLGSVVTFAGSEGETHTALDGFTITGGTDGISGNDTRASIRNCVIRNNTINGIRDVDGLISNCEIRDNINWGLVDCDGTISLCTLDANIGGAVSCDGLITETTVINSTSASTSYGAIRSCHGQIAQCRLSNNNSYGFAHCNANMINCVVSGSGLHGFYVCNGTSVQNSVIAGNKQNGISNSSLDVLNCTITGNDVWGFSSHTGAIKHAVIWDNTSGELTSSTTPVLSGTANPFFVQPGHWDLISDTWIDGDYHLTPDSPYIDAGDPNFGSDPNDPEEDLDGNPRVMGARIDLGPYEFQEECEGADFDDDGTPDICDSDTDNDGVSNTLDACDFTPAGVPVDENGRPDADLNLDCTVDLRDYAVFQLSIG